MLITKGTGTVERNGQTVQLADWEKTSFKPNSTHMEKVKEIGPPTPISPANMMPIFVANDSKPIEFSWTAMTNAKGYRLQISRNPYFSSLVVDRNVTSSVVMVSGLAEGPYYWMVRSFDAEQKESVESEKNRFTVIAKETDNGAIALAVDPFVQHGHVIELSGKTEVGARVMVNGHEVAVVEHRRKLSAISRPPLPNGETMITITAQNAKGGVNTPAAESGDPVRSPEMRQSLRLFAAGSQMSNNKDSGPRTIEFVSGTSRSSCLAGWSVAGNIQTELERDAVRYVIE